MQSGKTKRLKRVMSTRPDGKQYRGRPRLKYTRESVCFWDCGKEIRRGGVETVSE